MEQLIQFRLLSSKLTEAELYVILQLLIELFDKKIILACIFNHFYQNYLNQQNDHHLRIVKSMVSDMIKSRDSNKRNKRLKRAPSASYTCTNIDKLPSSMIRYCSSFLTTEEFLAYQQCSRFIYISCNKPSKLQCLNIINADIDSPTSRFCLNRFPFLKTLQFSVASFTRYINSNRECINNLSHLEALCISHSSTKRPIKQLMDFQCINFDNIQLLEFKKLGRIHTPFDFDTFCEFLSKFTNLKALRICNNVHLSSYNAENTNLSKLFPKLQILQIFNKRESVCLFRSKLLSLYSSQIVSLAYDEHLNPIEMYSDSAKVAKLSEIVVENPNVDTLNNLIHRSNLQRICIGLQTQAIGAGGWSEAETKHIINKIFTKCKQLKYMELRLPYKQFEKIINSAQISLFLAKKYERKALQICFRVNECDIDMETVIAMTLQFANTMDKLNTNDFMGLFYFEGNINKMDKMTEKAIIKKLNEDYLLFTNVSAQTLSVIVSNKDCKMKGRTADRIDY